MGFIIQLLEQFKCIRCPDDSNEGSIYPDCNCENVGQYNANLNECTKCAEGSTGIYPNCTCIDEDAVLVNTFQMECQKCPPNSSGKIPNCICDNGSSTYCIRI